MKYLGLYLIGGAGLEVDLSVAKRKYYGCCRKGLGLFFGDQVNKIMVLHLLKSY